MKSTVMKYNSDHANNPAIWPRARLVGLLLMFAHALAWANCDPETNQLALRKIMQDLGSNMQVITRAIASENWELVATTAPLIANHPRPPVAERMRILNFAGAEVGKFKGYDKQTHEAAKKLGEVALSSDGDAIITAFASLQSTCLACHRHFRKPFREHFYPPSGAPAH